MDYQRKAVSFTNVLFNDSFWQPRLETNRTVTLPFNFHKCQETERIDNFSKAAGQMDGSHVGIFFNDSDVFKVVEGAAYSLQLESDPELDRYLDDLIAKFAAAQEADGYLYTARTIAERNGTAEQLDPDQEGKTRWSHLRVNHELYNVGHMYEAAVAHYQATGKRNFLDVAIKNADLIDHVFGPDKRRDVPGHQEIEIGLARLYGATGNQRYLQLAKFFLDERGHPNGRELYENYGHVGYLQDHLPVVEQDEAVGHSVRAGYMYSGMADVAALTSESAYINAIDALWQNVVSKKLYLHGGIGAMHRGEAFGENYDLPNATAYAETCAAIANIMWNQRMFLLHGDAKYIDVLERSLYNCFLAGVGFSGEHFFYTNPLSFDGEYTFNQKSTTRQPWFDVSCCPTNVVRFLPSLPGYAYAQTEEELYVNLFVNSSSLQEIKGCAIQIHQQTNYPWDGAVQIKIIPAGGPLPFTLKVRIPGWAQKQPVPSDLYQYTDTQQETITLSVNGKLVDLDIENGYATLQRNWHPNDTIELTLPMPINRVRCHDAVRENAGRMALERGPLVYCVEAVDHGGTIGHLSLTQEMPLTTQKQPELLNGITTIQNADESFFAIPYYAWAHRGVGEMAIWLSQ